MEDTRKMTKVEARLLKRWLQENHGVVVRDPEVIFYKLTAQEAAQWLKEQFSLKVTPEQINEGLRRN